MIKIEKCSALLEVEKAIEHYFSVKKTNNHVPYILDNPQLEFIMEHFSGLIGIIDLPNNCYMYLSESITNILGLLPQELCVKDIGMIRALGLFPPDQAILFSKEILPPFLELCYQHRANGGAKKLKIAYNTQLKSKDGTYRWFYHQISILDIDEEGMPVTLLKMMHDIDDIKKDKNIQMVITKKQDNNAPKIIYEKKFQTHSSETILFTNREREILQLTSYGMSSKKIATELFISEHTVNTHKKNMLKKLNLSSSNELVRYAMMHGMIV